MDFDTLFAMIPGTPQTKATIAFVIGASYFAACLARGFFTATSVPGKVCTFLIDGLKPKVAKLAETPAAPKTPAAPVVLALLVGSLLFAAPARAQDSSPTGPLPSAGACFAGGAACIQPTLTVVPIVIDFRSGDVSHDTAFSIGYGLVFTRLLNESFRPGIDILGGTQTGGGWNAAALGRLGSLRLGPVITHKPGATYAGLGVGAGL